MADYHRPATVDEALSLLGQSGEVVLPLAGGTDLLPRWSKGVIPRPEAIVSLTALADLRGISQTNGEIRIGACTPICEIAADPQVRATAPVLAKAAGRIACPQVRSRATIGGNLCNASPAADTAVPLILLDAVCDVVAAAPRGPVVRQIPITEFFTGPGVTALKPGELLTHVHFEAGVNAGGPRTTKSAARGWTFSAWDKFGTRPSMEIAVASVGVALKIENGTVTDARVGYGSVAPTPVRGRGAEAELIGNPLSAEVIAKCVTAAAAEIAPISDVRAGADYRREVVGVMLRRMLENAASVSSRVCHG
ncbi:MAG: xanthine dehydrogenase family protein subunit M [Planctomycetes bacterium]|nr:xanthine dehydrogenase family protein subunit M [Planctomycetota bacterium]